MFRKACISKFSLQKTNKSFSQVINMVQPTKVIRKKCGQIYILANDIFSLICEYCGADLQALEDLRVHLTEHFPESPSNVKIEDSISCDEFYPGEIQNHLKHNLTDDLQGHDYPQSSLADEDFSSSTSIDKENIKSELEQDVDTMKVEDIEEGDESSVKNETRTEMSTWNGGVSEAGALGANVSHLFECDICKWTTTRKTYIRKHLVGIHTIQRPDKRNSKSVSLKCMVSEHLPKNTEKTYKCDMCSKSFSRRQHLNSHIRTHTGEKPYKCDVCSKSFSQRHNLSNHIRTHTGEKPYKCDMCSKRWSNMSNLISHVRTHTGEKPYKCAVCSKNFSHSSSLSRHLTSHTREKRTITNEVS